MAACAPCPHRQLPRLGAAPGGAPSVPRKDLAGMDWLTRHKKRDEPSSPLLVSASGALRVLTVGVWYVMTDTLDSRFKAIVGLYSLCLNQQEKLPHGLAQPHTRAQSFQAGTVSIQRKSLIALDGHGPMPGTCISAPTCLLSWQS